MGKFTYSREIFGPEGREVFTVEQANAFDEAQKLVEKGIADRRLALEAKYPVVPQPGYDMAYAPTVGPGATLPSIPPAPAGQ